MKSFLIKFLVNIISLFVVVRLLKGISTENSQVTAVAAIVLTLINIFIKPVLIILTLPFNILSLGLLTLVINGFLFVLVSKIVQGFYIDNYWSAFWGALLFSIVSILLNLFVNPHKKIHISTFSPGGDHIPERKYREVVDIEAEEANSAELERKDTDRLLK